MKRYCIFLVLLMVVLGMQAQKITVLAPAHVSAGENFRLSYTINTQDVNDFRIGNVPSGLEIIAGPYTSQQSSFQMVNGHTTSSSSITFTYTLYADKKGSYVISGAKAHVGNHTIMSKPVKITVSGTARNNGKAPNMHDEDDESQIRSAGSKISGNDLFIKVSANKRRVHEQEPVLLTYKVYTLVDLTQLEGKMPDLTGFHTQEVTLPQQKNFHIEKVNGRNYKCVTWSQYVMYPQMTGKLKIPSITFNGIVVQQNRTVDPFEAFLNGGSGYIEVKREIKAPGVSIQVDPLPKRPVNFSGGVGKFNISAQLDHNKLKSGEPLTLRIVVGGIGNLKLIKQPVVEFPKDFDKYDAKITDKTRLTSNGVEGNMIYDILAVPRNQGTYTIPSATLTYYDTSENIYKTIKTQSFTVNVEKGSGKTENVDNFSSDTDIHPIFLGKANQHAINDFFFGSVSYIMTLFILFVVFIMLLVIFHKRAIDNANIVKMRGKKANKVATKRLKKAKALLLKGKQSEFYDEVLRALWGYVGDKLNMPVEKLSRDNISDTLQQKNVKDDVIDKFISALDECEYERYAPGDAKGNMNKTFEYAITAIMQIEDNLKNRSKARGKAYAFVVFLMLLIPMSSFAITKENADAEYNKGRYQQAIIDYQDLLKKGVSAELYYNLGNSYYRTDNITQAVLAYERAHMLSPGNSDIRFNLQFARMKTIDKINPDTEMFFVTWYKSLVNIASVDEWAITAIVSIMAVIIFVLLYLFGTHIYVRKMGFFGAAGFLFVFALSNIFAYTQKSNIENRTGAIITSPSVNVKKTPSVLSNDEFVIHEGSRVDITDKSMKGWFGIKIADGREGWIKTNQVEEI